LTAGLLYFALDRQTAASGSQWGTQKNFVKDRKQLQQNIFFLSFEI
jgi:hypothetical protein